MVSGDEAGEGEPKKKRRGKLKKKEDQEDVKSEDDEQLEKPTKKRTKKRVVRDEEEEDEATNPKQKKLYVVLLRRMTLELIPLFRSKSKAFVSDTDEEEEAKFAHMVADDAVEEAEWQDAHGLDVLREHPPKEYKTMRKRAKVVGWYSALQETVFREEWLAEGGMFGQKGSGGPPSEEVGPMGETL